MQATNEGSFSGNVAGAPKDEYCYICEDGGLVMECTICTKCFCYEIIGRESPAAAVTPCVSVTAEMAEQETIAFPCPECLSEAQARSAPYIINRGARRNMRLISRTSVALIVLHLDSLTQLGISIYDQILAALGAFLVNTAAMCGALHLGVTEEDEAGLRKQLVEEAAYHLAVVFVTESNPGGGWWNRSGQHARQSAETLFLQYVGNQVRQLARDAITVRYFGLSCGSNLPGRGVVGEIHDALVSSRVLSLVLPSASSFLPCDYAHMLPELFVNLYYFGAPLRRSLYKVWGTSEEVRRHTGLLIIDRNDQNAAFSVTHSIHSPPGLRPLGVELPIATTICGCICDPMDGAWIFVRELQKGRESIFSYQSSCCEVVLHVAIFPGRRRTVQQNGTVFIEEQWNPETRSLEFKESTMVRMKVFQPPARGLPVEAPSGSPWTIVGKAMKRSKIASRAQKASASVEKS